VSRCQQECSRPLAHTLSPYLSSFSFSLLASLMLSRNLSSLLCLISQSPLPPSLSQFLLFAPSLFLSTTHPTLQHFYPDAYLFYTYWYPHTSIHARTHSCMQTICTFILTYTYMSDVSSARPRRRLPCCSTAPISWALPLTS